MPGFVVNLVTESGGIDNSQGDTGSLVIEFKLCISLISTSSMLGIARGEFD